MATQSAGRQTGFQAGFLEALGKVWNRYRQRRAAVAELQALDNAELEHIVRDIGLTFGDLLQITKQSGDSAALLYRRLEQAGIDFKSVDSDVLRDMQRCCSLCESKAQCEHELEDKPKTASWPEYCPNRQTLEALSLMKCH